MIFQVKKQENTIKLLRAKSEQCNQLSARNIELEIRIFGDEGEETEDGEYMEEA